MSGEKTEASDSNMSVEVNETDPKLQVRLQLSQQDGALRCGVTNSANPSKPETHGHPGDETTLWRQPFQEKHRLQTDQGSSLLGSQHLHNPDKKPE